MDRLMRAIVETLRLALCAAGLAVVVAWEAAALWREARRWAR